MKKVKISMLSAMILMLAVSLNACKTKKAATSPVQQEVTREEPPAEEQPQAAPAEEKEEPAPEPEKPDFSFRNIQFEFNSVVLKTEAYQILEQVAREMKKDPSARFVLNGHASSEGSTEHNMSLSVDRANAVKLYLVNAGIDASNLSTKGFGATLPVASNNTEEGRAQNRRVEIRVSK